MDSKQKMMARVPVLLGVACGVIGLVAGMTGHSWKLGPVGWFTGGALLALTGVFALLDAAVSSPKGKA